MKALDTERKAFERREKLIYWEVFQSKWKYNRHAAFTVHIIVWVSEEACQNNVAQIEKMS